MISTCEDGKWYKCRLVNTGEINDDFCKYFDEWIHFQNGCFTKSMEYFNGRYRIEEILYEELKQSGGDNDTKMQSNSTAE